MPTYREPLTDRQLAVLQWIADGCPHGVWPDHSHKLSVGALETRNLASVRRWYGKWNAVLLPDGRYYLDHGTYPGQEVIELTVVPQPVETPALPTPAVEQSEGDAKPTAKPEQPPARPLSPAEKLVAEVVASGGTMTIKAKGYEEERRVRAQIEAAQRHGKAPDGMELVVERANSDTHVLKLEPVPEWCLLPVAPIEVAETLRRPHDAVVRIRNDPRLLGIEGAQHRGRALRILQALAKALTARGHRAVAAKEGDHLRFAVVGHEIGLRISQLSNRSDHVPTKKELAEQERWSWTRIPKYDYTPSERLKITLTNYHGGSWSDGKRWQLESRLDRVVQAIERASVLDERARLARIERERQARLAEERRIARATERMIHANRVRVFDEQLVAWLRSRQIMDYLDAMEAVVERIDDPAEGVAAGEWLAWCRAHARAIDPLQSPLEMPPDPEANHATLAPFLDRPAYGWMTG